MSIACSIILPNQFPGVGPSSTMLGRDIIRLPVIKCDGVSGSTFSFRYK